METSVINVERTLCLIKPDIIDKCDEILHIIRKNGFYIVQVSSDSVVAFSSTRPN